MMFALSSFVLVGFSGIGGEDGTKGSDTRLVDKFASLQLKLQKRNKGIPIMGEQHRIHTISDQLNTNDTGSQPRYHIESEMISLQTLTNFC